MAKHFKEKLSDIKCMIFDVDGVFTDGSVTVFENGEQVRKMNIKDGYAVQLAVKLGYRLAIISGGTNEGVRKRFIGLGLQDVYLGQHDKEHAYAEIKETYGFTDEQVLYMGDDLPDLVCIDKAGATACPADAALELREASMYVCAKKGGEGCVREVIEQVLRVQNKWPKRA